METATFLASVTVTQWLIAFLFVIICVLLILVVLLQKGRGGGLAGAFGGVGGHSAFGAKTGDVFTWVTVGLTALFIIVAIIGNYAFVPRSLATPEPPAATTPAPGPETPQAGATQPAG